MMHEQSTETLAQQLKHSGFRRARTQKDWLSPSTWNCIKERWELKHSIMNCHSEWAKKKKQMYQVKDKEVKKRVRADKSI